MDRAVRVKVIERAKGEMMTIRVVRKYKVVCPDGVEYVINISTKKAAERLAKRLAKQHEKCNGKPHRVVPYIDTPGLVVRRVR